jgi:hypothetical protein
MVTEIRGHILERIASEGPASEALVARVLEDVGDPEDLAADCGAETALRRAAGSRSPLVLLSATWRWATKGVGGVAALLLAVLGYGSGAVCLLATVLKPLLPGKIGLWVAPEPRVVLGYFSGSPGAEMYGISFRPFTSFVLGTLGPVEGPVREVLGPWLYPVAWFSGVVLLAATTQMTRLLIAGFGPHPRPSARPLTWIAAAPAAGPRRVVRS